MTDLSPNMIGCLDALRSGPRSAYPKLSLASLRALQSRGLVTATSPLGSMAFPHSSIQWALTEQGRSILEGSRP